MATIAWSLVGSSYKLTGESECRKVKRMEKQVEMSGKDFEKCQGCGYLLAFNRQKAKGKDVVTVTCGSEQCVKSAEVSVK